MRWIFNGKSIPGYYPRIIAAVLCIVLAALTWFYNSIYIPRKLAEQEYLLRSTLDLEQMEKASVVVVSSGKTFEKGRLIDEEVIMGLEEEVRPTLFLPDAYLTSKENLQGKILAESLSAGEVLAPSSIMEAENRVEGYYRYINIKVKDTVLDTLEAGQYVDLLAHYDEGKYNILVTKVPIKKVGRSKEGIEEIVIPVDDYEQRLIEKAKQSATFSVRIYLDESQPKSPYSNREVIEKTIVEGE